MTVGEVMKELISRSVDYCRFLGCIDLLRTQIFLYASIEYPKVLDKIQSKQRFGAKKIDTYMKIIKGKTECT
jgi:hypothetical protein